MQQISKKRRGQMLAGLLVTVLLIVLDQVTKHLAVTHLKNAKAIPILPDIFELSYLENHGAAFGILQGQKTYFIIMTILILAILLFVYIQIPDCRRYFYMRFIIVLLVSGAIGNFIDRCLNNYVIDFFYFKLIDFPVFNVADIYVTVAAILLILLFCFYYKEEDIDMLLSKLPFVKKKEK